jgi:hypothetical protein
MKKLINEQFKRMQLLAGLITESQINEAATAEDTIDRAASNLAIKKLNDMGVKIDNMKGAELMKKLDSSRYSEMFQIMASYFQDQDALEKVKASMVSDGYPVGGNIAESQLDEAAGEDLELKSLAKKLFPIIKKYKMGVEYVTDTNEFNTKPQKTDPSFQVPARILIKDGILTLAVYFLSLAKSINELDMGSGPSSEQYDNAKKQAALMYKDIAGVIGNEFEFRSQPTTNEYGFYLIQIRKKITAKGGATNPNQRPNAPKPAAPVPTSESTDIEKSVNEALRKFRNKK